MPHAANSARSGGSTVRFGIGRVMSGKTTTARAPGRASSRSGGPASGSRSAAVTAPCSSARPACSIPLTTVAPSGTSTVRPRSPYASRTSTAASLFGPREPVPVRVGDRLRPVAYARLREEVVDVALDGGLADDEAGGDLGVRQTVRDQRQHLDLARRERVGEALRLVGRRAGDRVHEVVL